MVKWIDAYRHYYKSTKKISLRISAQVNIIVTGKYFLVFGYKIINSEEKLYFCNPFGEMAERLSR